MVVDLILTKLQNVIACKCEIHIRQCIAIAVHCFESNPKLSFIPRSTVLLSNVEQIYENKIYTLKSDLPDIPWFLPVVSF